MTTVSWWVWAVIRSLRGESTRIIIESPLPLSLMLCPTFLWRIRLASGLSSSTSCYSPLGDQTAQELWPLWTVEALEFNSWRACFDLLCQNASMFFYQKVFTTEVASVERSWWSFAIEVSIVIGRDYNCLIGWILATRPPAWPPHPALRVVDRGQLQHKVYH